MAYLDENFLLHAPTARRLFHEVAKDQPIIDYHCHLSPREIATNHRWENISDIWLGGDHYKWRLMRANGISEDLITGDSTPREKFSSLGGDRALHASQSDPPLDAYRASTLLWDRFVANARYGRGDLGENKRQACRDGLLNPRTAVKVRCACRRNHR